MEKHALLFCSFLPLQCKGQAIQLSPKNGGLRCSSREISRAVTPQHEGYEQHLRGNGKVIVWCRRWFWCFDFNINWMLNLNCREYNGLGAATKFSAGCF